MGITPHQARYRMGLYQDEIRAIKQALVDGRCKVGTATRKSPRKRGQSGVHPANRALRGVVMLILFEVPTRTRATPKRARSSCTSPPRSTLCNEYAYATPYWPQTLTPVWTPGLPWPYDIVETPRCNVEDFRTFDAHQDDGKYIDPSMLVYTASKS